MRTCILSIFSKIIVVDCQNDFIYSVIIKNFGHFRVVDSSHGKPDYHYDLKQNEQQGSYSILRNKEITISCPDLGIFIYQLEKDLTVDIQYLCKSLFFMHGAALEKNGELLLIIGRSGAGKSTTTWGLLNNGFNYLSDELAPIDLDTMHVTPYPHAICLKSYPPLYPLPDNILRTNRTMHVPVELLPCEVHLKSFRLTKVLIVEFSNKNTKPVLTKLSKTEACMNIYTNALNQLAHDNDGLVAASKIATDCECYSLAAAKLDETCDLINSLFLF